MSSVPANPRSDGIRFVTGVAMADPEFYLPLAVAAEEAGFDVVGLSDSVCYPEQSDSKYPYTPDGSREFLANKPFLEPMIAIAAMAAVTSRVQFCPSVLKLPIRHPVLFAKEATSLAVLSHNRLLLGAGTSPWPDDYEVVGLPWAGRGRRFVECVEILRGLETGGYFGYQGEFYSFAPIKLDPVPTEPIPLIVGGISAALVDRAATIGDGWLPTGLGEDATKAALARITQRRAELGRTGPFSVFGGAVFSVDDVARQIELGATHVSGGYGGPFNPYGMARDTEPLGDKIDRLRRFGDEVIAPARERFGG